MEKTMEATVVYWGHVGIIVNKTETTIRLSVQGWGYIGIMENKIKWKLQGVGFTVGVYWDNWKQQIETTIGFRMVLF